jgi:hypothetical protein
MSMRPESKWRNAGAVGLALLALWAIFLRNAFDPNRSFSLLMDNEFFIGTVLSSMSHSLSHGEWPLRMETVLGGLPLYNFPQLSPFYPFYFTALPLFDGPQQVVHSMDWLTLMHLLILEINTYVFLRVIGTSRISALMGSALFAFGANSLTYAAWLNITAPYAWFPLYLAGLVGIFEHPGRRRYFAMALAGIVLLALASPAQPLIHAVVVSGVFVLAYWASHGLSGGWVRTRYPLAQIAGVGIVALLIVAPVILPAALEFKHMIRWIGPFPPVTGNGHIPFEAFQVDQLSIAALTGVLFMAPGAAVGHPFVGVIVLSLACMAAASRGRLWIKGALFFIALYAIASSTGINLGLAYINHLIPILNKIREPSRFLILFQFAVTALAALGLDELRQAVTSRHTDGTRRPRYLLVLSIAAVASIILLVLSIGRIASLPWTLASVLVLVALIALTAALGRRAGTRAGVSVALTWSVAALFFLGAQIVWTPTSTTASKYNTDGGRELDRVLDRLLVLDPAHDWRVIFDGKIDKQMASMLASYKGIRTLNAYFNPAPKQQFDELYYHGPRTPNYFQSLGAKYLVCDKCAPEALQGYEHKEDIAGLQLYEATTAALPHAYAATALDGVVDSLGDLTAKIAAADLTSAPLFAEKNIPELPRRTGDVPVARCDVKEDIPRRVNRIRVTLSCPTTSMLVLNEFFDESWRGSIDKGRTLLLRVNGSQMGILVPPGTHTVELRFRPVTFMWTLPLSGCGLLAVMVWLIAGRKRRARLRATAAKVTA